MPAQLANIEKTKEYKGGIKHYEQIPTSKREGKTKGDQHTIDIFGKLVFYERFGVFFGIL